MTAKKLDPKILNFLGIDPIARDLQDDTRTVYPDTAIMQISAELAPLLTLLASIVEARNAIEIGTYTGYSALAIARGMPADGRLVSCDINRVWPEFAAGYWERAGVADKIEVRIAPANETLRALPDEPYLDLAFIDADKTGYQAYWEQIVPRTRPGGLIIADNALWQGRVLDPACDDADTIAIRAFNERVASDDRVIPNFLTIADGLSVAQRR
jgi:caffeoyl-CoA O-methyltransferase